jgi:hypothetical protein
LPLPQGQGSLRPTLGYSGAVVFATGLGGRCQQFFRRGFGIEVGVLVVDADGRATGHAFLGRFDFLADWMRTVMTTL